MFLVLVLTSLDDLKYFILTIKSWLIVVATYSILLFPLVLYYAYKMMYILKHYKQFDLYEVVLDNVSTSYAYRGAVYYTVTIYENKTAKLLMAPVLMASILSGKKHYNELKEYSYNLNKITTSINVTNATLNNNIYEANYNSSVKLTVSNTNLKNSSNVTYQ
jgi:hypothetical protein